MVVDAQSSWFNRLMSKRLSVGLMVISVLSLVSLIAYTLLKPQPVLVGVLHSQTGTMALSEQGPLKMTLAAIDHINETGGINGRPLKAIVADGASDERVFAQQAEKLLVEDGVAVIFGGWTSASRKAMLPVLEKYQGLLFYPVQYEGIEQSPQVIYTGMTPNQQLYPAITWMSRHFGRKAMLIGSDYIYPRMANHIARTLMTALEVDVCDEGYLTLGQQDVASIVDAVKACQPDFIVNSVNGDSNLALLSALRGEWKTKPIPIVSLSLSESELKQLILASGSSVSEAHYSVWSYFQSLNSDENQRFLSEVAHIAKNIAISHPMKAAWDGVHLWANAARLLNDVRAEAINPTLAGMSVESATGAVAIDLHNRHLWQQVYLGKALPSGQFEILWQSQSLVQPNPWPIGLTPQQWQALEKQWYQHWGQQWQAR